jgi:hypothetical protein
MMLPVFIATLAAYVDFPAPDLRLIYGLILAVGVIVVIMTIFRVITHFREAAQVRRSSWSAYKKIAKVKKLSKIETQIIASIVQRAKIKRPSKVLGSIRLFESVLNQALDQGWITDDEVNLLDKARVKLVRTARPWDGQNRRQFARSPCAFEMNVTSVSKEAIDEELKASYDETDEKFLQAFSDLLAESRLEGTRVQNLSAGGVALLAGDKGQYHKGDYLAFSEDEGGAPIDLSQIRGYVLDVEQMEEQRQLILHVRFLSYDAELRKQVIATVYEEAERSQGEQRKKKCKKKRPAKTPRDSAA